MGKDKLEEKQKRLYPRTPKVHETVSGWASSLRKQIHGKPSVGSVEKSKRRHNSKLKALNKYR